MADGPGIVADIGGTNARFALVDPAQAAPRLEHIRTLAVHRHATVAEAVREYLKEAGQAPRSLVFAVAAPVIDQRTHLTNANWAISAAELTREFSLEHATLVNDYEATVASLSVLGAGDFREIGNKGLPDFQSDGTIAVVGPGTGLGVAARIHRDGHAIALVTEGGHAGFAPADETEIEILKILSRTFGRVSAERLLSGPGLRNLHMALAEREAKPAEEIAPEQITARASAEPSSFEARVFARFCAILGSVAGDFALGFGAREGVVIAGGILPEMADVLAASAFRARFEDKARFRHYMEPIPTALLLNEKAGLVGAAAILLGRKPR